MWDTVRRGRGLVRCLLQGRHGLSVWLLAGSERALGCRVATMGLMTWLLIGLPAGCGFVSEPGVTVSRPKGSRDCHVDQVHAWMCTEMTHKHR